MDKEKTLRKLKQEIEEVREKFGIEFAEIVRCKDCKHWNCYGDEEKHKGECIELELDCCMYEDDFCSYGERRDDDAD